MPNPAGRGLLPICFAALRIQLISRIATMAMPAISGSNSLNPRAIVSILACGFVDDATVGIR
jgi:hypothetical protein